MKIANITAVILAGGKNSRIKREKSLIKIEGNYLIDIQVNLLRKIFSNIIITTCKKDLKSRFSGIETIDDHYRECGPLGGIHAAMSSVNTEAVFVFACDMPKLSEDIIRKQIEYYMLHTSQIVVPRHKEGIEPLHAVYSVSTLPYLENCLKEKKLSVRSFYEYSKTGYLDFEEDEIRYFFNINTYGDLKKII